MIFLCALLTLVSGKAFTQQPDALTAAKAEVEQGQAAMKGSDFVSAVTHFRKAIDLDPDNKEAHDSYFRAMQQSAMAEIKGEKNKEESKAKREAATQKLVTQYMEWAKQYPKKAIFPLFLSGIVSRPGVLRSNDSLRTFEMQVQLLLSRGTQKIGSVK